MSKGIEQSASADKALLSALKTILRPMVRLLIRQNITYTGLQGLLKQIYVKVADESFQLNGKRQTDSRISILTGVHRADVKKIRNENPEQSTTKQIKASLSAQMMSIWTGHQAYLNSDGKPKALFRSSHEGTPSFEQLILSVSKDKHPRSFLDDWLNQGIVKCLRVEEKEMIVLSDKGYIPEADYEEKLFFAGKNIGDHLSVVANNLENTEPAMFDRAVYYQELTKESVNELESLAKTKMLDVLVEINQRANELQEKDSTLKTANYGMHVGAYFYHNLAKGESNEK